MPHGYYAVKKEAYLMHAMRLGRAAGSLIVASLAAACSGTDMATLPPGSQTSTTATAAAQFNHMGDSVLAAGGSASDAAPFYGAAGVIGESPNVGSVSMSIDGSAITMNAVAVAMAINAGPVIACPVPPTSSGSAAPFVCPWGVPALTRTLFAWSPSAPTRIVELVATSDTGAIGTPVPLMLPGGSATPVGVGTSAGAMGDTSSLRAALTRPIPAHLEYRDSTHVWWGISGTQTNAAKPTGGSCPLPPTAASSAARPGALPAMKCQLATFAFAFTGVAAAPPVPMRGNAGVTGTHAVSLAGATLTGLYFTLMFPVPTTTP
jgi:hypothetical protein